MNKLTQALMEELTVEYVKVGSLQIPESVVISWVIMLLLVVGSILLTRNLKVDHISKRQAALEALYSLGKNFFEGLLGKEGSRYVPYLMTVALYIACSNVIGVFGVKPPTKDLDVTAALALDTSKVDCDYYNFLRGDRSAFNSYRGEYMTQYSWAEVTRSALRQQAAATPKSGSIPSYYVPPTGF